MTSPGVEIRPLFQITGDAEFNEVFFTDVRVPHSNLLGEVGDGWRVATTTLMNERVALGRQHRGARLRQHRRRSSRRVERAQGLASATPSGRSLRDRVTELWIEAEVIRLTTLRARASGRHGQPRPRGIGRASSPLAELNLRLWELPIELLGPEGMLHEPGYPLERVDGARRHGAHDLEVVPAVAGQHDRGRHLRDHAQHPRRAGPRPARRRRASTRTSPGARSHGEPSAGGGLSAG